MYRELTEIAIDSDWPRSLTVVGRAISADYSDRQVYVNASPRGLTIWVEGGTGWGCDAGLQPVEGESPICCAELSVADCQFLLRVLDAALTFAVEGAELPKDLGGYGPPTIVDWPGES